MVRGEYSCLQLSNENMSGMKRYGMIRVYIKEKVMDIADCDETLIEKYIKKEEGWEKIEDEYDAKHQGVLDPLIKKYGYTNDHGNKVERIIVGIGDEFIEEVY